MITCIEGQNNAVAQNPIDKIRSSRDRISRNDSSSDSGNESFAGNNLFSLKVAASLGLYLILYVASCDAGLIVLLYEQPSPDHQSCRKKL